MQKGTGGQLVAERAKADATYPKLINWLSWEFVIVPVWRRGLVRW
jgi:hypothetical protein